jgi:hypothetical protein
MTPTQSPLPAGGQVINVCQGALIPIRPRSAREISLDSPLRRPLSSPRSWCGLRRVVGRLAGLRIGGGRTRPRPAQDGGPAEPGRLGHGSPVGHASRQPRTFSGEVTERPKVQHWKCCVRQKRTEGSNPSLSANSLREQARRSVFAQAELATQPAWPTRLSASGCAERGLPRTAARSGHRKRQACRTASCSSSVPYSLEAEIPRLRPPRRTALGMTVFVSSRAKSRDLVPLRTRSRTYQSSQYCRWTLSHGAGTALPFRPPACRQAGNRNPLHPAGYAGQERFRSVCVLRQL